MRRRGIKNDGVHKFPLALFPDRTPAIPILGIAARQEKNWRFLPPPQTEEWRTRSEAPPKGDACVLICWGGGVLPAGPGATLKLPRLAGAGVSLELPR